METAEALPTEVGVPAEAEIVAFGRPATEALARHIARAQQHHPLDPVTVVVPSNLAGLSARRMLGSGLLGGSGVANVSFVTPLRLAEILGSVRLVGSRPLSNPVLAAAVRRVLADEPGLFAAVAGHQSTQAAVAARYGELSRAHPATLDRIAGSSRRGAEVVRLVRAVRAALAGYHDEGDLAAAATARVIDDPSATTPLGAVVWHLPERLSPALTGLMHAVLTAVPSSVIVGLTGERDADVSVVEACAAAGIGPIEADHLVPPLADRLISVSDPDEEVRAAVREVVALVERGVRLDRMAIFHPTPEPYARALLEQLDGAGVPHHGPSTARLADTVAGRTLLGALALPTAGWGRATS